MYYFLLNFLLSLAVYIFNWFLTFHSIHNLGANCTLSSSEQHEQFFWSSASALFKEILFGDFLIFSLCPFFSAEECFDLQPSEFDSLTNLAIANGPFHTSSPRIAARNDEITKCKFFGNVENPNMNPSSQTRYDKVESKRWGKMNLPRILGSFRCIGRTRCFSFALLRLVIGSNSMWCFILVQ